MKHVDAGRREFIAGAGAAWLASMLPMIHQAAEAAVTQREEDRGFAHLDAQVARDLEAVAEQIFPDDETPGARQAGVIWFIDAALGGFQQSLKDPILGKLDEINKALPAGVRFADLDWEKQTDILRHHESSREFGMLQFLTIAGMFALPSYGGNRDKLGWTLLGFENRHVWQPPFGYYDAPGTDPAERDAPESVDRSGDHDAWI